MPKKPDVKNLSELTGVIEAKPRQFEKVSHGIREAKSYIALSGNKLSHYLDGKDPAPADYARSIIGHLGENLSIAGEQAVNLDPEAAIGLDILKWVSDHGGSEASGVIPTGPLSATAWLNRQVQSIEAQTGVGGDSLYITAFQQAQMRLLLTKDSVLTEDFRVNQATLYSPRLIQTEIRNTQDEVFALTNTGSGPKFAPRVKHLTHQGRPQQNELPLAKATISILPDTTINILNLNNRPYDDASWGAQWLGFLGDRSATEKLTKYQFPVNTPNDKCSLGPIRFLNRDNRRALEIEVEQLGKFPLRKNGISINVKAGKKSQEIKFSPMDLPATIFLPGKIFEKKSGTTPQETAGLLAGQLRRYAQALLAMTAVEVVSK